MEDKAFVTDDSTVCEQAKEIERLKEELKKMRQLEEENAELKIKLAGQASRERGHPPEAAKTTENIPSTYRIVTSDGEEVPWYTMASFDIKKRIASGGYGTVLLGYERKTATLAAIKLFDIADIYAQREVDFLMKHSRHSQDIVEFLGVLLGEPSMQDNKSKPSYLGYVMKYMERGSLDTEIMNTTEKYSVRRACQWLYQIAGGLKYLHDNNRIHRDIKPANILLADIENLKLGDFGLVREISGRNTNTSGLVGTSVYIAPEVITTKNYGTPADIYSLGITMWEIFHRKSASNNIQYDTDELGKSSLVVPLNSSKMNDYISNFLQRCCRANPEERPLIAEVVEFFQPDSQNFKFVAGQWSYEPSHPRGPTWWESNKSSSYKEDNNSYYVIEKFTTLKFNGLKRYINDAMTNAHLVSGFDFTEAPKNISLKGRYADGVEEDEVDINEEEQAGNQCLPLNTSELRSNLKGDLPPKMKPMEDGTIAFKYNKRKLSFDRTINLKNPEATTIWKCASMSKTTPDNFTFHHDFFKKLLTQQLDILDNLDVSDASYSWCVQIMPKKSEKTLRIWTMHWTELFKRFIKIFSENEYAKWEECFNTLVEQS